MSMLQCYILLNFLKIESTINLDERLSRPKICYVSLKELLKQERMISRSGCLDLPRNLSARSRYLETWGIKCIKPLKAVARTLESPPLNISALRPVALIYVFFYFGNLYPRGNMSILDNTHILNT